MTYESKFVVILTKYVLVFCLHWFFCFLCDAFERAGSEIFGDINISLRKHDKFYSFFLTIWAKVNNSVETFSFQF